MKRVKTPGDRISIDLIIYAGEIVAMKLANPFNKSLINGRTPKTWGNAIIILIHKKGIEGS